MCEEAELLKKSIEELIVKVLTFTPPFSFIFLTIFTKQCHKCRRTLKTIRSCSRDTNAPSAIEMLCVKLRYTNSLN